MAKSGPAESGLAAARVGELKKELRRLVRAIAEEDDSRIDTFEGAARALAALKDLRFRGSGNSNGALASQRKGESEIEAVVVPEHFLCPISAELMRDPVVVASGQTYDRAFIEEWLSSGNRTCPQTQRVLSDTTLTPNHLVRSMISQWCIEHGVTLPPPDQEQEEGLITGKERNALRRIFDKMSSSSSVPQQKQAVRELRLLTKRNRSFRALVGANPDTIPQLLSVLSAPGLRCDPEVQEDTVTTILNLSIHDSNKKTVGDNPRAIPLLIDALQTGTMETRSNAAAALFSLSALDCNKLKIGESGAMKPLVELLEQGSPSAKKDAGSAIFNLCMVHENRARAVRGGAVGVVLKAIGHHSLVDESLAILALLSSDQDAVEEIARAGGVPRLLGIVRDSPCARNKENAAVVLFAICMHDRTKLREVGEEEEKHGSISRLAQNGTSRARRKAAGIIDKWKRASRSTHYSC
ncbi:U-box domain-containing protein 9 [Musa troglodytarum]|uniref:RING-type E3 ubiquitin transferase n=1 Tax=Musa troglodytarum TaxID=320322 RepID=A0A9E7HU19_9LILI|nr:U-box domain-containing protein 9 [Musa troglodytarum]